ncbi:MAG TPA: CHASE2 domain-containing protein [Planktothrix sp.]|jgi:signal transduction histidine kinase
MASASNQQINRDILATLPVIIAASLLTIWMDNLNWFSGFENATTAYFQQVCPLKPDNVFFVAIDENDYKSIFHGKSPLDPDALAELIKAIAAGHPRAVVVDLDTTDHKFRKLLSLDVGVPIIWGAMPSDENRPHSHGQIDSSLVAGGLPIEEQNSSAGADEFWRDPDQVVRCYYRMVPSQTRGSKEMIPSLPWSVARQFGRDLDHPEKNKVILRFIKTDEASSSVASATAGPPERTIDSEISSGDVLSFYRSKKMSGLSELLAARDGHPNKIAILAGTFKAGRDTIETPVGMLPSAIVIASAIETELQHGGIFEPDFYLVFVLQIFAGLLFAFISFRFAETIIPLASLVGIPVVAFLISLISFESCKLWIDFVPALVVLQLFYSYLHIKRVRKRNVELVQANTELSSTKDKLGRALESGAEHERKRVTTEIHDETQDYFSMVKAMIKPMSEKGDANAKRAFDAVSEGLAGLRRIMHNLYPPEFEDENATFLQLVKELAKRKSSQMPTEVRDETDQKINQLARSNWFPAYRIVQQALANAAAHAEPSQAIINLSIKDSAFVITVTDDGKGLPEGGIESAARSGSYGTDSMRARTELMKGSLTWVSPSPSLGKGTDVVLSIPMSANSSNL